MRNYEPGTNVLRRHANGLEDCLVVVAVVEGQVTFRQGDGKRVVRECDTSLRLRYALCGYRVLEPADPMVFPEDTI